MAVLDLERADPPLDDALALVGSAARRADLESAVSLGIARFRGLDIVVCNAGVLRYVPILELDHATWQHVDVILTGTFLTAQIAARAMVAAGRGGSIIVMTSTVAEVPAKTQAQCCAVTAGGEMLRRQSAGEFGEVGVRVNVIAPGWWTPGSPPTT